MSEPATLRAVTDAAVTRLEANRGYRLAILAARQEGNTLAAIAGAAGTSPQNVHKLLRRHDDTKTP